MARMYKAQYSRSASYARYLEGELKALREYMNENYKGEYVATIEDVGGFPKIRIRVEDYHILVTRFSMAQYRIMHFYQLTDREKADNDHYILNIHTEVIQYEVKNVEGVVKRLNKLEYVLQH